MATSRICSIPNCGKPAKHRGWCQRHYMRWWRHGDPLEGRRDDGEALNFYRTVVLSYEGDDCLNWPYNKTGKGYAQLWLDDRMNLVSRLVCQDTHGAPPSPSHVAAHSCGRGLQGCVNKHHLSWKTGIENAADKLIHGTHTRGERNGMSKLTEATVREIRTSSESPQELANRLSIWPATINGIRRRRGWAWL